MRHLLQILLFILTSKSIFAQCPNIDKLKFGGSFATRYGCYDPKTSTIEYFNDDVDTINYCCHISKIQKYADFILNKSEKYIKQRGGILFYNKLAFHNFMVIYHDYSIISSNYDSLKYNLNNCGRINYWLTYIYSSDTAVEYYFGLEFDSNGNRISEHMFPDHMKNKNFTEIIRPCKALEIGKNQNVAKIDSIKSLELNYDNEINSFVWLIKEDFPNKEGWYEPDLLFINANTGLLYKKDKEYWSVED